MCPPNHLRCIEAKPEWRQYASVIWARQQFSDRKDRGKKKAEAQRA
jgi:hypothetical protein